MTGLEIFFLLCAAVGGAFVLIRTVLQFFGADADVDTDFDAHHADPDLGFKWLSLHGVTSFLMMFGLVGFTLLREGKTGILVAVAGGTVAGAVAVWAIGRLFASVKRLQASGNIRAADAAGCRGTVYMTIPSGGTGRVTVSLRGRQREYDARVLDGGELKTGTAIRVVRAEGNLLLVEKI